MSENEIKETKEICPAKKELEKFLLTLLASFLGCIVALCVYNASLRPQPPCPIPAQRFDRPPMHQDIGARPNKEFRKIHVKRHRPEQRFDVKAPEQPNLKK